MEYFWWCALAAQAALIVTPGFWRSRVSLFKAWIVIDFIVSLFEYLMRNDGTTYAYFWQASLPVLVLLLIAACLETIPSFGDVIWPWFIALAVGFLIHVVILLPHRWPESWIEDVEAFTAFWSLLCGLTLIQLWQKCRIPWQAFVLCGYCLGKSICYYAAPASPATIGRWLTGITATCMVGWVIVFSRKDQYLSYGTGSRIAVP